MSPGFTGSPLDRADRVRNDAEAYGALLGDWRARILGLDGLDPVLAAEGGLVWHSAAELSGSEELILLGLSDGKPHFVALAEAEGDVFRSPAIWRALSMLPAEDAAIYGTARSLIEWHNGHRFCGKCGHLTTLFRAGWGRKCGNCGKEHFPRTDPVVIMLAEYDGKALVGRQSRFPPGNYSALAGFLEPGESIEEAVRREIHEEAGITCGKVRYVTSQPWPFGGAQLMIACIVDAVDDAITLDTDELEDAKWISKEEAQAALENAESRTFNAPPPFAIAHSLLKHWATT
ncbi:NAD(+) diphosphatase [Sphingorhabdus sp. IMCC26285]|jgi:NAD+ diphosphatase|uniref:NAD(+) diphosphatase n=1 Tax=Sphingorhabdus profundilacus TaxID=2509718 RepID=A0A6I4M1Q0_9SPHN|nr:NAD(+) diphosphatase [Sphingorhabdus profundilacus]MVZ96398.1 NAD(+) diphosphatase [Sphingorhabdus profundilacus]